MKKLLFLFLLVSTIAIGQQTKFQKIDSLLIFLNANDKFMGSVAIRQNGTNVFSKAYGFADVETQKKLDENTKLKVGSITKTFTAIMIMQLIDEKKLALDTKLSRFYPKIPNADKITIHHLLHHRTGIPDYLGDANIALYIYLENKKEDILKRIEGYASEFDPNSKFKYSNSNYNLLGYILEDITKKSYAENLNSRIVKKLGLKNTSFPKRMDVAQNDGYSYAFNGKTWEKTPEWSNSLAFSSGAIASTPNDLNILLSSLFDGKLVSAQALEQMIAFEDKYGKALVPLPFDGRKIYGHTGGIESFRSITGYLPEDKTAVSVIVNGDNYDRNTILSGILALFYEQPFAFPDLKGFAVNKDILNKYKGAYSCKEVPLKITVDVVNGELTAKATGQSSFPLTAESETEFVFTPGKIKLVFGENKFTIKQGGMEHLFIKD